MDGVSTAVAEQFLHPRSRLDVLHLYSLCLQKSLTSDRWYSVNPPPIEDRRHKFPNPWKDPNYDHGDDHLYLDFEYSAVVGLREAPPVLPKRRVLPALCFIGEANTRTRLRGVDQAKLILFGGCVCLFRTQREGWEEGGDDLPACHPTVESCCLEGPVTAPPFSFPWYVV